MTAAEFRAAEDALGGLSKRQTADLLGCGQTAVAGYRRGESIPEPVARLIRLLARYPDLAREVRAA